MKTYEIACYFCQAIITGEHPIVNCPNCSSSDIKVGNGINSYNQITYVHLTIHNYSISWVRLNILNNSTELFEVYSSNVRALVKLPGFPITPSNILQKLKTYSLLL